MINFVVLTDFSTAADKALHYTTLLASQVPSQIHLVHFWQHAVLEADHSSVEPVVPSYYEETSVASYQDHEQALRQRIEEFGNVTPIMPHFETGSITKKLPAYLAQLANAVVVMGKNSVDGLRDGMVESTAVNLIALTRTPFLIVPEQFQHLAPPEKIVIALHLKEIEQTDHAFQDLITWLKPEISIIHVSAKADGTISSKVALQAEKGLGLTGVEIQILHKNSVTKAIKKYCRDHEKDLLVLLHRKHSFLLDFFNQSVTGNFIRHTSIPLLILPG